MGCGWFSQLFGKRGPAKEAAEPTPQARPYQGHPVGVVGDEKASIHAGRISLPASAGGHKRRPSNPAATHEGNGAYEHDQKRKDEGIDDAEDEKSRKEAEEAKRKAEEEEQERLDFFQML